MKIGLFDKISYVLAKKFCKDTIEGAGAKNLVFGGRYLRTAPTAAQLTAIANGTFEGLLLGDHWTSGGINYRTTGFHLRRRKREGNK